MIQPRVKYNSHNSVSYSAMSNMQNMANMSSFNNRNNVPMSNFGNQMFLNANQGNPNYYQTPTYNTMNYGMGQAYPMNFYNNRVPYNYPGFGHPNQANFSNNFNLNYMQQNLNYSPMNQNYPSKGNSQRNSGDLSNLIPHKNSKGETGSQRNSKGSTYSKSSDNDSNSTEHIVPSLDTFESLEIKPKAARKKPNSDMNLNKLGDGKRKTSLFLNQMEDSKKFENAEDFQNLLMTLNTSLHVYICSQKGSR